MTEKIKAHLEKQTKSYMCLIPGGLTSQLQPADLSWNKPFKTAYRELYNEWMASGENRSLLVGILKLLTSFFVSSRVTTAWATVSSETIISSFKNCGISVETDVSEDAQIHCIKPGQMAASATAEVITETAKLVAGTDEHTMDVDDDPFSSDLEEDEAIIKDE